MVRRKGNSGEHKSQLILIVINVENFKDLVLPRYLSVCSMTIFIPVGYF